MRTLRPLPSSCTDRVPGARSATVTRAVGGTGSGVVEKEQERVIAPALRTGSVGNAEHGVDFVLLEVRHGRRGGMASGHTSHPIHFLPPEPSSKSLSQSGSDLQREITLGVSVTPSGRSYRK